MSEDRANSQGQRLIKAWQAATDGRVRAEIALAAARASEALCAVALGKYLAPADAVEGENFGIWDRDLHGNEALFSVLITDGDPLITMRRR